ncbi:MAG: GldG family protein [Nitrospira sp.]
MNRLASILGIVGASLGVGGFIAYSLTPDALWLVSLCEGLALIALIAFFVLHFETLKAFSTRRSTRLGAHSVLMVALLAGILVIVNFLAAHHVIQWDVSETQHFTLAPQTHRVLRGLTREVRITVFTQERSAAFNTYRDLLDSYRSHSNKLRVDYVDPDRKPGVARQYSVTRADMAVVESGGQITRVAAASEAELTGALIRVTRDQKKRIVFLEGHGERGVDNPNKDGISTVKASLEKQGYEVGTLTLVQESAVPANTAVLVLPGPRRPVTGEEQERIARYVDRGGRLLVLLDPESQAGLDPLLARWDVTTGKGVLVDFQDKLAQGGINFLLVRRFVEHEITHDLTSVVLFPDSHHLNFDEKTWTVTPLAQTSPQSRAVMHAKGGAFQLNDRDDIKGPLSLAVAGVPKKLAEDGQRQPAVVVVGNSSFASNAYMNFPGNTDFLLHIMGWLAEERELISIMPKEPALRPFIPNPLQERTLLYVQVLLLPIVTVIWGLTTWRRRKRL